MIRLLHTADWHLGKTFSTRTEDPARQERLRAMRFQQVAAVGRLAQVEGAAAVLVAGDLFHTRTPEPRCVIQALEAIGTIGVPVVAIPGNHDHEGPGSVWESPLWREQQGRLAPNLIVLSGGPQARVVAGVAVLALPVARRRQNLALQALEAPAAGLPPGLPRIGLVHASCGGFAEAEPGPGLDTAGLARLGLAGLALGDYHRQQEVPDLGLPAWYAGTHEPDGFPAAGQDGAVQGGCLRLELTAGQPAVFTPQRLSGGLHWVRRRRQLRDLAAVESLLGGLQDLCQGLLQHLVLQLDLLGSELDLAGQNRLRQGLERLDPLCESCTWDPQQIGLIPGPAELAALQARSGLSGAAATRLLALQENGDPATRRLARAALIRLHRQVLPG